MAYFSLLPIFMIWMLLATATVLITRSKPSLRHIFPIALSIAVWSSVGFIGTNLAFVLVIWLGSLLLEGSNEGSLHQFLQLVFGLLILGGPIVSSAIGWAGGFVLGLALNYKKSRASQ